LYKKWSFKAWDFDSDSEGIGVGLLSEEALVETGACNDEGHRSDFSVSTLRYFNFIPPKGLVIYRLYLASRFGFIFCGADFCGGKV